MALHTPGTEEKSSASVKPSEVPMRSLIRVLGVLAFCALAALVVAGCGADSVEGTAWRGSNAQQGATQLQFTSGSECVMTLAQGGYLVKESTLRWSQDGEQVSVESADGSVVVFIRDGSILKSPAGGTSETLFKQNSALKYSKSPEPLPTSDSAVEVPTPDTRGTYSELVTRANGLYDQGSAQMQQDEAIGAGFFAAAAAVYAAALEQKGGDPGVTLDYAVSLFYSGDTDMAMRQVDAVIAANPDFSKAYLNKGIFLTHEAKLAEVASAGSGSDLYVQARVALEKAASVAGAANDTPVQDAAQSALDALPQP